MNSWIAARIEKASWLRFVVWTVLYIGYSTWAFATPGPWMRTLSALGASNETLREAGLPELTFGFPVDLPGEALSRMGPAVTDYAVFQGVDIPFALLGAAFTIAAISLGLKRFRLGASPIRFVLMTPLIYLLAEFVENSLLAFMALNIVPVNGALVLVQQSATSVKFLADYFNTTALVVSIGAVLIAAIANLFRRKQQNGGYHGGQ